MQKIKVYVSEDEYNKIRYYRHFVIEEGLYSVGDIYEHEEIKEIKEIKPDVENNLEIFNYQYFQLITTLDKEYADDTYNVYYIAVRKEDAPD